jgi:hypothetical protein
MSTENYRLTAKLGGAPIFLGLGAIGAVLSAVGYVQGKQAFFAPT